MSKTGRPPFGTDPVEGPVIEVIKIKRRARKGSGGPDPESQPIPTPYSVIARELNAEGYRTQTGKLWYSNMVKRILNRPVEPAEPEDEKEPRRQKTDLETGDYLTRAEVRSCRRLAREDEAMIFETLLGSGLRAGELCELELRDLGLWFGKKQIDVRKPKGKKKRRVVKDLAPRLRRRLRQYLLESRNGAGPEDPVFLNKRGRRLTYKNLRDRIIKLGARARINTLHAHALRHTFGTFLYNYSKDIHYVKRQMGHASVKTTEIYIGVISEDGASQMKGYSRAFDI